MPLTVYNRIISDVDKIMGTHRAVNSLNSAEVFSLTSHVEKLQELLPSVDGGADADFSNQVMVVLTL